MAFVALSAVAEGYDAYAVVDCSGTWSKLVQEAAVARMAQAGIKPITWVAVGAELQGDWRNPTGPGLAEVMGRTVRSTATSSAASRRPRRVDSLAGHLRKRRTSRCT